MDPQLLRGGFRLAFLIVLVAVVTLPFQPFGSAEFVVTVLAALVGAVFLVGVAILSRLANTPLPGDRDREKGYNGRFTKRGR